MSSDPQRQAKVSGYAHALERIRAEYVEMPGMRLTPQQVHRLSGQDVTTCKLVLDDLVRANFLRLNRDGTYVRFAGEGPSRLRVLDAEMTRPPSTRTARKAS